MFARRICDYDELGDLHEDYVAVEVPSLPRRPHGPDRLTAADRRDIKLRAMRILKENGFTDPQIAVALSYSSRHVRRRKEVLQALEGVKNRV
jgi:hypothetical protein